MAAAAQQWMMETVVRMVVPMRREFGQELDVYAFMRDTGYARDVLARALTSQVERLRNYAELVDRAMHASEATAPNVASKAAPAKVAPNVDAAFALRRRNAARDLVNRVGPLGEDLAIRIEGATELAAFESLLLKARSVVINLRGAAAGSAFFAAASTAAGATEPRSIEH